MKDFNYVPPNGIIAWGTHANGTGNMNHSEIVSFLWGVADLIRDTFKRGKYQDVILPLRNRDVASNTTAE